MNKMYLEAKGKKLLFVHIYGITQPNKAMMDTCIKAEIAFRRRAHKSEGP